MAIGEALQACKVFEAMVLRAHDGVGEAVLKIVLISRNRGAASDCTRVMVVVVVFCLGLILVQMFLLLLLL